MPLGPLRVIFRILVADGLAQPAQPLSCPGKLRAQYCQPYRNDDETRSRRYQHDYAQQYDS
jgi:hypothetical protein